MFVGNAGAAATAGGAAMLQNWRRNLAVLLANRMGGDARALVALGDRLWGERGTVYAAHSCYLLADCPLDAPSRGARLVLVGADHRRFAAKYLSDITSLQRTEVVEYAKKLHNSQTILKSFQPYKLIYAMKLADYGLTSKASDYVASIRRAVGNASGQSRSPYSRLFLQQLSEFEERLSGHIGKSAAASAGAWLLGAGKNVLGSLFSFGSSKPNGPTASQGPTTSTNGGASIPSQSIPNHGGAGASAGEYAASAAAATAAPAPAPTPAPAPAPAPSPAKKGTDTPKKKQKSRGWSLGSKLRGLFLPEDVKIARLDSTPENDFYYNKELKRWVRRGEEHLVKDNKPPPPPMSAAGAPAPGATPGGAAPPGTPGAPPGGAGNGGGGVSGAGAPATGANALMAPYKPKPRSRRRGARSRYVDTLNKGVKAAPMSAPPARTKKRAAPKYAVFAPPPQQ